MLKTQTALATGHFSNQLGFWGAVIPLVQARMCNTNQAHRSLVRIMVCSLGRHILSANEDVQYKQSISSVKMISSQWQAAKISQLENVIRNL